MDNIQEKRDRSASDSKSSSHAQIQRESLSESRDRLLHDSLLPEDSYHNGMYWADLPSKEQSAWVHGQNWKEVKREFKHVGKMTKEDPLSPVHAYFSRYVTTGMVSFRF